MLGIGQSATKLKGVFIVYKVTNVLNGKAYIGISSRSLSARWSEHKERARQGARNSRLHAAMRKYGLKAFRREVVAITKTEDEARELETKFIVQFDTYGNGYNCNLGGRGFLIFPDHIREKISLSQKGKIISAGTRQKMAEAKRGDSRCAENFGEHTQKGAKNPRAGSFLMRFPDGTEHVITGMREFCRRNKLHLAHINSRGHSKGFALLRRLNDHPEREYSQAAGKSGGPQRADQNMVSSA